MQYFSSCVAFVQSFQDIKQKIAAIDEIIAALFVSATAAAAGESVTQYSLNDGQTIISATPRSVGQIKQSIVAFEQLRNMYASKINGRVVRLVDVKNLIGRNGRN